MTKPFNTKTAYADDWRYFDNTEFADWEPDNQGLDITHRLWRVAIREMVVRQEDITQPDFAALTVGVGVTSASTVFCVWNPTDQDFAPQPNDVIALDSGQRYVIKRIGASVFSRWIVLCEPEKQNT